MFVSVLLAYVMYTMYMNCPSHPKEGIRYPRNRLTEDFCHCANIWMRTEQGARVIRTHVSVFCVLARYFLRFVLMTRILLILCSSL